MEQLGINGANGVFPPIPAGYALRDISGSSFVTLASNEGASDLIELTGTLTSDVVVTVPLPIFPMVVGTSGLGAFTLAPSWLKVFKNSTTGGYNVTIKGPSGPGVVLAPSSSSALFSKNGQTVDQVSAGGGGGGGGASFPFRLDLSVNKADVDNAQSSFSVLTVRTGSNPAGAFNGGGTGNKAILGVPIADNLPLSAFLSTQYIWNNISLNPATALYPYLNFIVEPDPVGAPGVYRIFVLSFGLGGSANSFTVTNLSATRFLFNYTASINTIQVVGPNNPVSVFPPVAPVVNLGANWQSQAFRLSDILAAYPNARFRRVSSGDGGLPNATVTPPMLVVLGDSNNQLMDSKLIEQIQFNGVVV